MSWSTRRKFLYLLIVVVVFLLALTYFLYPLFKENPVCTDGKQNGTELGIDCGGICTNLCLSQVHPISISWQRSFPVAPGVYDVIGYVENQNADAGVPNLLYKFKLYDEKNVLVAERDGKTFIGPNQTTVIFESHIETGKKEPKRVFLEFEEGYQWIKTDPRFEKITFSVKDKNLTGASTTPRLSATISNDSLTDLSNVEVAAILRDSEDNALAVSKTVIDFLPKQTSRDAYFTWLKPFSSPVYRTEIIPRVDPFNTLF